MTYKYNGRIAMRVGVKPLSNGDKGAVFIVTHKKLLASTKGHY